MRKIKFKTGTGEWAEYDGNIQEGCRNGCLYCYACYNSVKRFKKVKSYKQWCKPRIMYKWFNETAKKLDGRIMYPTRHDIHKEFLNENIEFLKEWLSVGNEILITTKPDFDCIKTICQELLRWRDKIIFRMAIGSKYNDALEFWEPGAPSYESRYRSLKYAYGCRYRTSVSCEPYLDGSIISLVDELKQWVTDTIWIGKMNKVESRVDKTNWGAFENGHLQRCVLNQTDDAIREIYSHLKNNEKVRWKDSIKRVLNLPAQEHVE